MQGRASIGNVRPGEGCCDERLRFCCPVLNRLPCLPPVTVGLSLCRSHLRRRIVRSDMRFRLAFFFAPTGALAHIKGSIVPDPPGSGSMSLQ